MRACPLCGTEFGDTVERCDRDGSLLEEAAPYIGRTVGSYQLTRCLGRGGMGAVYEGVHPSIGSKVAVKFLHRRYAADRNVVDRFFNEARAVNLIGHDNIVRVSDFSWLDDGSPYFVMEFLEGRPLSALCNKPQPLETTGPIFLQMADALQAAHEKGIIHRDLKPDNVHLGMRNRRANVVKIVDFGIAKLQDLAGGGGTQTGTVMGTAPYMAPEQAGGEVKRIGPASDIYSMGVIMFQLATGRLPFEGGFGEILVGHLTKPPPAPRSLVPEIPEGYEAIILHCLAKQPEERFASMQELYDTLGALLDMLGISREPPMVRMQSTPGGSGTQGKVPSRPPLQQGTPSRPAGPPSRPPSRPSAPAGPDAESTAVRPSSRPAGTLLLNEEGRPAARPPSSPGRPPSTPGRPPSAPGRPPSAPGRAPSAPGAPGTMLLDQNGRAPSAPGGSGTMVLDQNGRAPSAPGGSGTLLVDQLPAAPPAEGGGTLLLGEAPAPQVGDDEAPTLNELSIAGTALLQQKPAAPAAEPPPAKKPRSLAVPALIGAIVLLAGAGTAFVLLRKPAVQKVQVVLKSEPPGAKVTLMQGSNVLEGVTPAPFELDADVPVRALFEGDGLVSQDKDFTPAANGEVSVALARVAPPTTPPAPVVTPPPTAPAAPPAKPEAPAAAKTEDAKADAPRAEVPKADAAKGEAPKTGTPKKKKTDKAVGDSILDVDL